jgi:DNA/RNA-binding domain of Phe-tRNA-synthetase-like protein
VNTNKAKGPGVNYVSELKQEVVRGLVQKGITAQNFAQRPVCQSWQRVFQTFKVSEDKASTIHNLLRRASGQADKVKASQDAGKPIKADLGKISDVVLETETPMGALDKSKVTGEIVLRYGKDGEKFVGLGREVEEHPVTASHIVYADEKSILTWLWNYRDGAHCCVPPTTTQAIDVLIFADQAEANGGNVEAALQSLASKIKNIGWSLVTSGVLDASRPTIQLAESQVPATASVP